MFEFACLYIFDLSVTLAWWTARSDYIKNAPRVLKTEAMQFTKGPESGS